MLTGAFYPEISGGGIQAWTLINALNTKINFYVITTSHDFSLPRRECIGNVNLYRVIIRPNHIFSKVQSLIWFLRVFLKIRKRINILHFHGFSQKNIFFIILAKIFKKKIIQKITSFGDDDPVSIQNKRFGRLRLFFFSKADIFISVSPAISRRFLQSGIADKKLFTIANGVDTKRFIPLSNPVEKKTLRRKLQLPEENKIIIFVGFLYLDKGADLLITAWKRIRAEQNNNVSIVLIGSTNTTYFQTHTNLFDKLLKEIEEFRMGNEIIFIEKTLEIEKYYQASDIFILPSRREGLPNALLEAMSSGLACIATRLTGITDYVIEDNKDGLLFEKNNMEELAAKLKKLLNNEKFINELGHNAREKIKKEFSIEKIAGEYLHLYKCLDNDKGCP